LKGWVGGGRKAAPPSQGIKLGSSRALGYGGVWGSMEEYWRVVGWVLGEVLAGYVQEGEGHKKEPTECSEVATIFAEAMLADRKTDTVKIYHPPHGGYE